MAISRHWISKANKQGLVKPSFRQACEFDFFRGQTGTRLRPDIFDDGTLSDQPFRKVKAFTDVGNIESMSKEGWDACSSMMFRFDCGALRGQSLQSAAQREVLLTAEELRSVKRRGRAR